LQGVEGDYLQLEYAGGDKLYLPVTRINLIQRYAGSDTARPRMDKLGGTGWENTKQRVKKAILAMAGELLNLYAKRELAVAHAFPDPDPMFREFEAEFPFEETPDQQKAIDDCLKDLHRGKPMDRLVCGDVGYGKTEVALRAAMMVALGGKQVAVLAPTTVLAQQHFYTFRDRMKNYPVRVEVVSSFRASKEVKQVLERLKKGEVDVIIGTHRLLNPDVSFKDLGLIVVDEEHRFGVQHKERLKQLKHACHVLTLTATPIPRTLQMSFFGVRDLSLIQTPPLDRRSVRTTLARFNEEEIKETISRELHRGGQVYFVHNRVQSIHAMKDFLQRLVPEARIGVGHGQMDGGELEKVMIQFINKETNILLCTTIIESGIDIPTANTIIINRADRFGLAQLHQLRGRVGRSSERAFSLLLIPPSATITPDAKARLEVLQKFTDLGAGFQVAQHDLELRGAGELLGKAQHGQVAAVGFEMYAELLAQAVQELKGKAGVLSADDAPDPEVNLPLRALIPDNYIQDVHERLGLYQRLASARDSAAVYDEIGTATDLYGEPPPEVSALAEVMVLKQKLREMHARGLDVSQGVPLETKPAKGPTALPSRRSPAPVERPRVLEGPAAAAVRSLEEGIRIHITLGDGARLDGPKLMEWIAKDAQRRRLTPQMKLVYTPTPEELMAAGEDVTALCRRLLNTLLEVAPPGKTTTMRPAASK
jgi:transcription-repair coupling factor (superfamily II helicase)